MGGEATITIPGTSTKVPKWAPLAAVGVIAAFVLLRPKTAEQGDFNEEGELEEEGTGFGGFDFDDLLNELGLDQGLEAPGQPMEIGYSADSPIAPLSETSEPAATKGYSIPGGYPVDYFISEKLDYRPGADRSPVAAPTASTVQQRISPSRSLDYQSRLLSPAPKTDSFKAVVKAMKDPSLAQRQQTPVVPGTRVAITPAMRTLLNQRAPARAPIVFARPTSGGVQEGGGAGGPPSLPDWLWNILRTRTGRTVAVAAQREMERWNSSPAATWARRSVNTVNRAFTNEASARRGKVLVSGIVTGGEAISRALGGWPYNRKP